MDGDYEYVNISSFAVLGIKLWLEKDGDLTLPVRRGVGMIPKGFLSRTLLRMNQNQPNFFYPSSINKKQVENFFLLIFFSLLLLLT